MMNIGLLPDNLVIDLVRNQNLENISISSYEGFIRQIIGWRNYVFSIYILEPTMYKSNFLNHDKKLDSNKYWYPTTGILPLDNVIDKIQNYAYCNHIERLMILGNWFLINQIHPQQIHRYFMEWSIDAYDWVMVPNIMGMSQYADGGKMMSRLYFSSSNYIKKMSNFKQNEWRIIWDVIYYVFIDKHKKILEKNYMNANQVLHWIKKTKKEKKDIYDIYYNL